MMRDMRRLACVALFLISSHPATALPQSQKSQIWRIPVLPSDDAQNSQETPQAGAVAPSEERVRFFQRLLRPADDEQVSAQELSINKAELERSRTLNDALLNLGLVSLGGEAGAWGGGRVSMRGFPGREPEALLEGVSLGSGFTGAHSLELVPKLAVESIRAYPFLPAPGLPRRGLAGAYDLTLKVGSQRHRKESIVLVERPESLLLAHREEMGCKEPVLSSLGCIQLAWQSAARTGAQSVRDDNNTPLIDSDDFETQLKQNDLFRTGISLRITQGSASGISFDTVALFGAENRGINGLPVAQASSDNRSQKMFGLISQAASSLSPETGRMWRFQVDSRLDSVDFSTRQNTQDPRLRQDEREERAFGLGLGISQPAVLRQWDGRFFLNTHIEHNLYRSHFGLGALPTSTDPTSTRTAPEDSALNGQLTMADIGAGAQWTRAEKFLLRFEIFAQLMSTKQDQQCGDFAPQVLCARQSSVIAQNSPGAALEAHWSAAQRVILYALLGRSARLPTPAELAGRPDGVVANLELKPESALFIESGIHTPYFHGGAFFSRDNDLIALRQVNPYLVRHFNTSRVHRGGLFGRAQTRFTRLEIEAAHEQIWAKAFSNGAFTQDVPFVPERNSRGTLRWFPAIKDSPVEGGFVALHVSQTGAYTLEPEAIYRLSPPALLGLEASAQITKAAEAFQFSFKVDNLLDARTSQLRLSSGETRAVAWSYLPALPIMGRSIIFSLKLLTA